MSPTFLGILIASVVAIAYWRMTLLILTAVLIALLATGVSSLTDGIQSEASTSSTTTKSVTKSAEGATGQTPITKR